MATTTQAVQGPTPNTATVTTTTATVKPGWKTSEYYFKHLAILVSVLIASGVIPVGGTTMKIVMIAAMWLTSEGYTVSRTIIKAAAMLCLMSLALHSTACGASANQKALQASLVGVDSASALFLSYDIGHQHAIVDAGPDAATVKTKIAEWRTRQAEIEKYFTLAYRAIAAAAIADDNPTLQGALDATKQLTDVLNALGVKP